MANIIRFVGDIHGDTYVLYRACSTTDGPVIQVGDFGVGFIDLPSWLKTSDLLFIRGNHDDPGRCREIPNWIPDGFYAPLTQMMFVGGAWSIDQAYRIPGLSWWPEEELNDRQFEQIFEVYAKERPRVMVTHDFPHSVIANKFNHLRIRATRTSTWLDSFLVEHQPELWVGGHWHKSVDWHHGDTRFRILDINEVVDIDMETLEISEPINIF